VQLRGQRRTGLRAGNMTRHPTRCCSHGVSRPRFERRRLACVTRWRGQRRGHVDALVRREVVDKGEEVRRVGAAERKDRLVVVADDRHAVVRGEQRQQLELRGTRVLELVEDAAAVCPAGGRVSQRQLCCAAADRPSAR
jgi:hypothetical protein